MISSEIVKDPLGEANATINPIAYCTPERFHSLDALRSFAMLLGIWFHSSLAYSYLCPTYWPVQDPYHNTVFDVGILIIHSFRMELFFLLSGFFANLIYQKKNLFYLIKNRLLRIGLPFLIGWFFTMILIAFSNLQDLTKPPALIGLPIFHLWYLYYLLLLYSGAAVLITVFKFMRIQWTNVDKVFSRLMHSQYHIAVLVALTLPMLFFMELNGVDTPLDFIPQYRLLFYYSVFFWFGWLIKRQPELLMLFVQKRRTYLILVLLSFLLLMCTFNHLGQDAKPFSGMVIMVRVVYALSTWSLILFITGVFQQYFNKGNNRVRYLADASYWSYIFHWPIIIILQNALVDVTMPGILKPILITFATLFFLFLSYHILARQPFTNIARKGQRR